MAHRRNNKAQSGGAKPQQVGIKQAFAAAAQFMRSKNYDKADEICVKILGADPLHLGAMHLRGSIAYLGGRSDVAITIMQQILALKPDHAQAHNDLGMMLEAAGRHRDAEIHLKKALEIMPKMPGAHLNLGNVYRSTGRQSQAEKHYRRAIRLKSGLVEAYGNLSLVLVQQGRAEEGEKTARKGIRVQPRYALNYSRLGSCLDRQGRFDEAIAAHEKAIAIQPDLIEAYLDYAYTLAGNGDMEKSKAQYRKVLEFSPEHVMARASLAWMGKFSAYDDDIAQLEKLARREDLDRADRVTLSFALGKAFEDIGDYQQAFSHFKTGNALHRKSFTYSKAGIDSLFADITQTFDAELFSKFSGSGYPDRTPIFILGMPRSGTSLTEQILSSHADVVGAGELSLMNRVAGELVNNPEAPVFGEVMGDIPLAEFSGIGRKYIEQLRSYSQSSRFITDKMPGNMLYIGLIKLILPNAKVIHCRRSAPDTCLSIFKTSFSSGGLQFAYDLEELGQYYNHYRKLMAHWHKVLPGFVYDLEYEALIADQRGQTEKLLQWCDLEWSDDCMNFFRTKRTVSTASITQVRRPVYSSSVQLWRKYGDALNPLLAVLDGEENEPVVKA